MNSTQELMDQLPVVVVTMGDKYDHNTGGLCFEVRNLCAKCSSYCLQGTKVCNCQSSLVQKLLVFDGDKRLSAVPTMTSAELERQMRNFTKKELDSERLLIQHPTFYWNALKIHGGLFAAKRWMCPAMIPRSTSKIVKKRSK